MSGVVYYITYKKKRHRIPWSFWVPAQDPALPDAINHQEGGDIKKPRRASGCGEFVRFLVRSMKLGVFLNVVFVNLPLADGNDDVQ